MAHYLSTLNHKVDETLAKHNAQLIALQNRADQCETRYDTSWKDHQEFQKQIETIILDLRKDDSKHLSAINVNKSILAKYEKKMNSITEEEM